MKFPAYLRFSNRKFLVVLLFLFIIRGIQIQCLYPPLEGPDEYQHIAYLVYMNENHQIPVYGQVLVPLSMYPSLVENPHSEFDWQQTAQIGARRYEDFYDSPSSTIGNATILLYQAQHPPLFYIIAAPIFGGVRNSFGFLTAVYAIRILNIVLAGIAIIMLLAPLRSLFNDNGMFRAAALAISLSPMFMIYVSRVANDALALFFVGATVLCLTRLPTTRFPFVNALVVGILLALGTFAKLITVSLIPTALVYVFVLALLSKVQWRIAIFSILIILGAYFAFTFSYFFKNIQVFGIPFVSQETLINNQNGVSLLDTLQAIKLHHIWVFFINKLIRDTLWVSGWSFLTPNRLLTEIYFCILVVAFGGLIVSAYRFWKKRTFFFDKSTEALLLSILIVTFTALAAYANALSSIYSWGRILTPTYYVMSGYPSFLTCSLFAASGYGKAAVYKLSLALSVTFLVTEYYSLIWTGTTYWAQSSNWTEILSRLASIHPSFLSPNFFAPIAAFVIFLTMILAWSNSIEYSSNGQIN